MFFSTLQQLLTIHKKTCAKYFEKNYEIFFIQHFHWILTKENYFLQRLSLQLLKDLLWNGHNFAVIEKFLYDTDILNVILMKLSDISQRIRMEAFHIFKLFLENFYQSNDVYTFIYCHRKELISTRSSHK